MAQASRNSKNLIYRKKGMYPEMTKEPMKKQMSKKEMKKSHNSKTKRQKKVGVVMKEFKKGKLHSGSGKIVKSRKQAIAISLSEAGLSRKKNKW